MRNGFTKKEYVQELVKITSGLLASGDYTEPDDNGWPSVITNDHGKDHAAHGFYRRFEKEAVIEAEKIFEQILAMADELEKFESEN